MLMKAGTSGLDITSGLSWCLLGGVLCFSCGLLQFADSQRLVCGHCERMSEWWVFVGCVRGLVT